jgi:transcriptional pleiotropic regulator of transition state genes
MLDISRLNDKLKTEGRKEGITLKSTGIVRKVDELGRIVLPIELRRTMDIGVKDMVEIFVEDDKIVLKKYHPACIFCGDARDVVPYKGKLVCKSCMIELGATK